MMIENFVNPSERHVLEDLKQARGLPRRFCSDNVPRFLEPRRRSAGRNSPVWPHVLFKSYILFIMERKFRADRSNN